MSKNKYYATKTELTIYEVFADDVVLAMDMVKNRRYRAAGSEREDGYSTILTGLPLVEYKIIESKPQPKNKELKR